MCASPDQQLLINARAFQTRVALVDDKPAAGCRQPQLRELHLVEPAKASNVGNLLWGRVQRILPGMQAALVDVGLARPGFLHASDIERRPFVAKAADPDQQQAPQAPAPTDIRQLVHEGQMLRVQVAKDPIASKGARLTTQVTLASRFLVLTPDSQHIGISQRLDCEIERARLQELVAQCAGKVGLPAQHGFIVRTVAEGVGAAELLADMEYLKVLWQEIEHTSRNARLGDVLHSELPVEVRVLRDLVNSTIVGIRIDDEAIYNKARAYLEQHSPAYLDRIALHEGPKSLFDSYAIEPQIKAALGSHVALPCGGYLVIEQTEAMITVDVNTGGYTGSSNLEETVFRTNMEAASALPAQLRLRNLGGLVAVDFIDMTVDEHKQQVFDALTVACAADPTPTRLLGISEFGIVELSRKRTRESLYQQLSEVCASCQGSGRTKKPSTVCFEILRTLECLGNSAEQANGAEHLVQEYVVHAHEAVVQRLLTEQAQQLQSIVDRTGLTVSLQNEAGFAADQFDLVSMERVHDSVD